jgi:hypothetical protein
MKNSEQPISPCILQQIGKDSFRLSKPNDPKEYQLPVMGLTKLEYASIEAMKGLLAADAKYGGKTNEYKLLAIDAINHAKALLIQLEEKQT